MDIELSLNIRKSPVSRALFLNKIFPVRLLSFAKPVFYWAFWIVLALYFYGTLNNAFTPQTNAKLLGSTFFLFSLEASVCLIQGFFKRLKETKPNQGSKNIADFLSFEAARALVQSTDTSDILYYLLKENPELRFVFSRFLLDRKGFLDALRHVHTDDPIGIQDTMALALQIATANSHVRIEKGDLLCALAQKDPFFYNTLIQAKLSPKDMLSATLWLESLEKELGESKKFWSIKNLRKRGTLAKNWSAGYTTTLDAFSIDITDTVKKTNFPRVAGHKKEIEQIERILSGNQRNNVLLVGEPGSGRSTIVLDLASRTTLGESLSKLNYKRVLELNLSLFLARVPEQQRDQKLDQMFAEVMHAGNVILVLQDIHHFIGDGISITSVLLPYLNGTKFPIIATCDFMGLHRQLEQNPSLLALFEKVEVAEISQDETLQVLERITFSYERKYKKFVAYQALKEIMSLCEKYIQAVPFPRKALDLLDEAMTYLTQIDEDILLPKHIAFLISQKTQIPVGELQQKEKEVLLNLEDLIHKKIINQEEAVKEVATALRRGRTEIETSSGPMGSFLFLGPTGVGKTETAKALASIYFGSENRMVRLDMSEFQNVQDVNRLLGSSQEDGILTTPIRENPFSLVLLDELEKAHPNILNLFLQVLDDGRITDGVGRKVSFQQTIVIATSNAGHQLILDALREQKDFSTLKQSMIDFLMKENIYRPEFLNRFDGIIIFKPLTKKNLMDIVQLMLKKLQQNLAEKGIEFHISELLKEKLAEIGYDPLFGARPMKRVIQNKVEDVLATALLKNDLKPGDKVEIDVETFTLKHI